MKDDEYFKNNEYVQAEECLNLNVAEYHNCLGKAQLAQGKSAEAKASFESALQIEKRAEYCANLGKLYLYQLQYLSASMYYDIAALMEPTTAEYQTNVGCAIYYRGKYTQAEQVFTVAARLNPTFFNYYNLGVVKSRLQKHGEATASYINATMYGSQDNAVNYATQLQEIGGSREAEVFFQNGGLVALTQKCYIPIIASEKFPFNETYDHTELNIFEAQVNRTTISLDALRPKIITSPDADIIKNITKAGMIFRKENDNCR
jgi:tetratricopeptide (TPR) repeat protein